MNRQKKYTSTLFVLLLAMSSASVQAKDEAPASDKKPPVVVTLSLKRIVTDDKGEEKKEDAPSIKPLDLVEYSAEYRNQSKQTVKGVEAILPVPKGLVYIKQSAKPSSAEASIDGAKYAAEPLLRTEKDQTGKEQQVQIPYAEYRSLRWIIGELAAGKKVVVSARMRAGELTKSPEELVTKPIVAK